MLSFIELNKPHIDIELYGCKKSKYSSICRIGSAGDKGRDVVAYHNDGSVDYYQCKHYNVALMPTNYCLFN